MLDSLEASEPMEHDNGAWLSVVAVPSTQPCKDPSGECERAFGMGIFLFGGLTFQVCGDCLQSWAILGVEGVFERPFGDAIALAYERCNTVTAAIRLAATSRSKGPPSA